MKSENIFFVKNLKSADVKDLSPSYNKILMYSDFYGNINGLVKFLAFKKTNTITFYSPNTNLIRWRIFYSFLLTINPSKNKFYRDSNSITKINFGFFILEIFKALSSISVQFIGLLIYLTSLLFIIFSRKRFFKLLSCDQIYFLRTNEIFHLKAGGSLGHIIGIIDGFISNNFNVSFLGIDGIKGINKSAKQTILAPPKNLYVIPILSSFFISVYFYLKSVKKIKLNGGAIYIRISNMDISPILLKRVKNVPLIVEFNSFLNWENQTNSIKNPLIWFTNLIERLVLNESDLIVCVSDVLKNQLISKGYKESKILVCYNGVNFNRFDSKLQSSPSTLSKLKEEKIKIGFIGTFGPWHGIDLLIDSINLISPEDHSKIEIILIGDGSLRFRAQKALDHYENVHFMGIIDYKDVPLYLQICDILLSPHKLPKDEINFIGSPTKLFEYMAMEKVIIATNLDQISEVISPSLTNREIIKRTFNKEAVGVISNPNSVDFNKAISLALNNIDDLRYLGGNARNKVIQKYSWKIVTRNIIDRFRNEN